ncbi:hypothetical protein GCM10027186_37170 [Micromonospora schwarzwaldensis]
MASATSSNGTRPARQARTHATNRLDRRAASVAAPVAGEDMRKGYVLAAAAVSAAAPVVWPAPNYPVRTVSCRRAVPGPARRRAARRPGG